MRIDYLGAFLIAAGVSAGLIWVTLGGQQIAWVSTASFALVGGALLLLVAAIVVESRTVEPVIPLSLFRNRTLTLAVVASVGVGVTMFGTSVFLAQYMQLARGLTPTGSGLITAPLVVASLLASTTVGQLVTRTGRYKKYMVAGAVLLLLGTSLMATIDVSTSFWLIGTYMALIGLGMGSTMRNLVLATQNTVGVSQMGVATATVTFFRSLGGAVGVAALGALLAGRVATLTTEGLARIGLDPGAGDGSVPDVNSLPLPVREVVEGAYGDAIATVFLAAIPLAVVALVAIALLPETPLGTRSGIEQRAEQGKAPVPA